MIPVNDLRRQLSAERERLLAAMAGVVDSGWLILGPSVTTFEDAFADHVGASSVIGVANGTDALVLAMRALGLGPGHGVLMAANAGGYAATAARLVGATPVYADVDERGLLDPDDIADRDLPLVSAVVVTHLYGQLADVAAIRRVLPGVPVIEDCAQAHGAGAVGGRAGSHGDVSTFSFYPTKNLGAIGDGGAVATSRTDLAEAVRSLRTYGWSGKYEVGRAGGTNSRLDELQAAVLSERLADLDRRNARRTEIAAEIDRASGGRVLGAGTPGFVAHLCVITTRDRDDARRRLAEQGVSTDVHYPIPDHLQPAWSDPAVRLPVTQRLAETVLTLPCFPELSDAEVEIIVAAVESVVPPR